MNHSILRSRRKHKQQNKPYTRSLVKSLKIIVLQKSCIWQVLQDKRLPNGLPQNICVLLEWGLREACFPPEVWGEEAISFQQALESSLCRKVTSLKI